MSLEERRNINTREKYLGVHGILGQWTGRIRKDRIGMTKEKLKSEVYLARRKKRERVTG